MQAGSIHFGTLEPPPSCPWVGSLQIPFLDVWVTLSTGYDGSSRLDTLGENADSKWGMGSGSGVYGVLFSKILS